MKSTDLKKLKDGLSKDIAGLSSMDLNDPVAKAKKLVVVQKEVALVQSIEKARDDKEERKNRQNLEERKFNHSMRLEESKQRRDIEQVDIANDLEERKYELERYKTHHDVDLADSEAKKARVDKIIDTGAHLIEVTLPILVYAGLVLMNFRLVYKDEGRSPSDMKDLLRNVIK